MDLKLYDPQAGLDAPLAMLTLDDSFVQQLQATLGTQLLDLLPNHAEQPDFAPEPVLMALDAIDTQIQQKFAAAINEQPSSAVSESDLTQQPWWQTTTGSEGQAVTRTPGDTSIDTAALTTVNNGLLELRRFLMVAERQPGLTLSNSAFAASANAGVADADATAPVAPADPAALTGANPMSIVASDEEEANAPEQPGTEPAAGQ